MSCKRSSPAVFRSLILAGSESFWEMFQSPHHLQLREWRFYFQNQVYLKLLSLHLYKSKLLFSILGLHEPRLKQIKKELTEWKSCLLHPISSACRITRIVSPWQQRATLSRMIISWKGNVRLKITLDTDGIHVHVFVVKIRCRLWMRCDSFETEI